MQKVLEILGSKNAYVSYFSILMLALTANGIDLKETPEHLVDLFYNKNFGSILGVILANFLSPALNLVQKIIAKQFTFDFLKSPNFITSVLTVVSLVGSVLVGQPVWGIFFALLTQVVNTLYHTSTPAKGA